ncbi:type VI secretion system ATPase TssH [Salmonella enterica]|nr:type VI secretion system ATPase TssH [Salmonella enterica]EEJ9029338.1 type VI secretion system ATPase TssH [Salmonella enterica subsp. enterica]
MNQHLKPVVSKLNTDGKCMLDTAVNLAVSLQHNEVLPEHLLLALIQHNESLFEILNSQSELNANKLYNMVKTLLEQTEKKQVSMPFFSDNLVTLLVKCWLLTSTEWNIKEIGSVQLILTALHINCAHLFSTEIEQLLPCNYQNALQIMSSYDKKVETKEVKVSGVLSKYTRNLSELARNFELDPVLGRDSEIRKMIDILLRRRQNNPILTGDPGVGKTALVEGLALRIAEGNVPPLLKSMEVLTLDLGLLQAGASVKGEFENRLKSLLKEVICSPKPIILFIDEAHSLIGAGGQPGQNDAANLLKPALARGELRIIAATTWSEYKKYFEKDAALTRRFEVIKVTEPDIETATIMLRSIVPTMSHHHGVRVLEQAVHSAVLLSSRYLTGRQLPDKSVSLLDTACARVSVSQSNEPKEIEFLRFRIQSIVNEYENLKHEGTSPTRQTKLEHQEAELRIKLKILENEWKYQAELVNKLQQSTDVNEIALMREALSISHLHHAMVFECVDSACVADVVSDWTGIPLGRMLEQEHLQMKSLFERLTEKVIGQRHALEIIAQRIRVSRSGLADPIKPTGVFLLAGPSGTGKTETALVLSKLLLGSREGLIIINMSEYQEAHSVSGLKGSPPGYIGYGQGGVLTEAVRHNPYSVVLLDEVEKAHPDILEIFYQIFDKGMIEDSEGQIVNFRNTLIIMTSNLASTSLIRAYNAGEHSIDKLCCIIRPEFEQVFSPALMGRITLIPYLPLQKNEIKKIITLKLQDLYERVFKTTEGQTLLTWSKQVIYWISDRCIVKQSGARDIEHVVNNFLLPLLADKISDPKSIGTIKIDIHQDTPVLIVNGVS